MLGDLKGQLQSLYAREKQLMEDLGVFNIAVAPNEELRKLEAVSRLIDFVLLTYPGTLI